MRNNENWSCRIRPACVIFFVTHTKKNNKNVSLAADYLFAWAFCQTREMYESQSHSMLSQIHFLNFLASENNCESDTSLNCVFGTCTASQSIVIFKFYLFCSKKKLLFKLFACETHLWHPPDCQLLAVSGSFLNNEKAFYVCRQDVQGEAHCFASIGCFYCHLIIYNKAGRWAWWKTNYKCTLNTPPHSRSRLDTYNFSAICPETAFKKYTTIEGASCAVIENTNISLAHLNSILITNFVLSCLVPGEFCNLPLLVLVIYRPNAGCVQVRPEGKKKHSGNYKRLRK